MSLKSKALTILHIYISKRAERLCRLNLFPYICI